MNRKIILIKDTDPTAKPERLKEFSTVLQTCLRERELDETVQIVRVADIGIYDQGIAVRVLPEEITYCKVTEEHVKTLVEQTIVNGKTVDSLQVPPKPRQMRVVLRNCGVIDPENIDEYIAANGYQALKRCLFESTPDAVIEEFKKSGLRGRGGAGFPTWLKWKLTKQSAGNPKYVICNADEGDPGAYMDRSVLEGDPHSVIEGLAIAAYCIGASKGFFYIRAEYPLAIERAQNAINQAREYGLLGENILGSNFSFDLDIRLGAGAFVCGEETALIASIEGKRGTPMPRPPFPSVKGLWGKPTSINNVETLANVPYVILHGGEYFARVGIDKSRGTKVFALTGKIRNSGLIEVPMGISLRDIVYEVGGGISSGKGIKAIQTGGPSGGVISREYLDTPVSYEELQRLGSIMGSGGMIVMDDDDCMVDIARFYLRFCVDESCGKCAPCRNGSYQMLTILNRIAKGAGQPDDMGKLKRIAKAMQKASLCGLGQGAPNPIVSTMQYFEQEYKQHIFDKKCPTGKCSGLVTYKITPEKCKRCRVCVMNGPVTAISGDRDKGYTIDQATCIKCGRCFEVCKFNAITRE